MAICNFCGKEYKITHTHQKYCTLLCANKSQIKEKEFNNCLYCNKPLSSVKMARKYCNKKCAGLHKVVNIPIIKICPVCNNEFETINETYCSHECYGISLKKERICKHCNKIYFYNNNNINGSKMSEYCSIECKEIAHNNRKQIYTETRKCLYCNKDIIITNPNSTKKYCSKKCVTDVKIKYIKHKNVCATCGVEFIWAKKRKYCSRDCLRKKQSVFSGMTCLYKNIKLRSTFELRVCNILDIMILRGLIENWSYETDKIDYIGEDEKNHKYIIDFKIFTNNNEFYYIEAKGKLTKTDELKIEAVINQGFKIELWRKDDIKKQEKLFNISKQQIDDLLEKYMCKG